MTDRRVAFVTCTSLPELQPDDTLAAAALAGFGITVEATVWSDRSAGWNTFDAVILRSTWDYHVRTPEFLDWLDSLERENIETWNPQAIVRWNADKRYLLELSAAGVEVVPTVRLEQGRRADLLRILEDHRWPRAVVKPAISGGAHMTWIVDVSDSGAARTRLDQLLSAGDVLVQPFLSEIGRDGEWSLVFFEGEFSHAVLKRPAPGDFRVQDEFGGRAEAASAPQSLVEAARRALSAAPGPTLYARVDGCIVDGTFRLLELELIEPTLFLDRDAGAPSRFAGSIIRRLT